MASETFEEIEHTADWAIKVRGHDLASLFVNAARGMMELAGVRVGEEGGQEQRIELAADDAETLLVDWLHELIVALELDGLAYTDMEIEISEGWQLEGSVMTFPIESMDKAIKAVTFNELHIIETPDQVEATVVFDV